jgi:hypothetical protein
MEAIFEKYFVHIIWAVVILCGFFLLCHIYKFKRIIDLDKSYKKTVKKSTCEETHEEGHPRDIWDYKFFPGFSKLFIYGRWENGAIMLLMLVLIAGYLFTLNDLLRTLVVADFGVIIGKMVQVGKDGE